MAITVICSCGQVMAAAEEHAGRRVRCPGCKQPVAIPVAEPEPEPEPAPGPAVSPADGDVWTSFERHQAKQLDHVSKQLDYLGGLALAIANRLVWALLLLALLASGCAYDLFVVQYRR